MNTLIPTECHSLEDFHIVFLWKALGLEMVSPKFHKELEFIIQNRNQPWKYRVYQIELLGLQSIRDDPSGCPHKEFVEDVNWMSLWTKRKCNNYSQTLKAVKRFYS